MKPHLPTRPALAILALVLASCTADRAEPIPDPAGGAAGDALGSAKAASGSNATGKPAAAAGLSSVCWIETGAILENTSSAILVRSGAGNVLVDGGTSTDFHREIEVYPLSTRAWLSTFPGSMVARTPLSGLLRAAGLDPKDVNVFLPSHPHVDHVGGLMDMPDVSVKMTREDMDLVKRGLEDVTFEVVPAHARRLAPLMQELRFAKTAYRGFAESADLLGDGTVMVVRLPGHTPGSVGTFVRVRPGLEIFHVGDAASTVKQIEEEGTKPFYLQRTDLDPEQTQETVALLHDLHAAAPEVKIIPAHDRTAWKAAFGEPNGCLVP